MADRILIDACVLYPTVMRAMVLGVAGRGLFEPVWSARILEEWARAAVKLGAQGEAQARGEIALVRAAWTGAERPAAPHVAQRLWLPDPNDIHVLATAVDASADAIMTLNAKDFPRGLLVEEGLSRVEPDSYLIGLLSQHDRQIVEVAEEVLADARRLSGEDWEMRALLKKARLPRLAKALTR
ncbi:MAG: PIN domain-containing protein [Sulfitobacter sp.]|nr:PIN domain-containing protein [Sulfitobacter sp.]